MQAHISRLSPAFMKISRGRLFQFALPGVLLPFSHASPAFAPLFKFANRHGTSGDFPLWTSYDVHSPRFLPAPQSRGRLAQNAPPGVS